MSKERENGVVSIAITALRFMTPLLLSILVWNGLQMVSTTGKLVETMQAVQISLTELKGRVDGKTENYDKALYDHELRLRELERVK